jgi:hypothetical protein
MAELLLLWTNVSFFFLDLNKTELWVLCRSSVWSFPFFAKPFYLVYCLINFGKVFKSWNYK